jgi:hypothetical protein
VTLALWRHRASRLRSLSPREAADLGWAQWYLLVARAQRWWTPSGRFVQVAATGPTPEVGVPPDAATRALSEGLAIAIERAAGHGLIRPTCLERAVALQRLLRRHGVTSGRIRVGVQWQNGAFLAHAWVELGGIVLADSPRRVRAFTSIGATGAGAP